MSKITSKAAFEAFLKDAESRQDYVRPLAFGIGIAHVSAAGSVLDTWFPFPNYQANYGTAAVLAAVLGYKRGNGTYIGISAGEIGEILEHFAWCEGDGRVHGNVAALKGIQSVIVREDVQSPRKIAVVCFIPPSDQDSVSKTAADAYLRLHLLSHRLVKPHGIKLDGLFAALPNNYWTSEGPVAEEDLEARRYAAIRGRHPLLVHSRDKFPRMLDYVQVRGVRVANADRVRLGAYLGEGTTVMHEGFVNFNAGTLGASMVEGRISAGVVVGDQSDIGGGASIMGTLSGGGKEVVNIGRGCLIGANGGTGISLGDLCVIEAGLYVTAGTPVEYKGETIKAGLLSGKSELTFRRNGRTGTVEVLDKPNKVVLNEVLHNNA